MHTTSITKSLSKLVLITVVYGLSALLLSAQFASVHGNEVNQNFLYIKVMSKCTTGTDFV